MRSLSRPAVPITLVGLCLVMAGCAPDTSFPTLRPRAIESAAAPTPAPATAPQADTALDAQVTALAQAAAAAAASFEDEAKAADPIVARGVGSATGSEAWVQAQQALARLEAAREPLTRALAGLDALRIEAQARGDASDTSRLDAAWTTAQALQQRQIERYEALAAKVPAA